MADQLDPKKQERLNQWKSEEVKLNKQIAESMDTGTLAELTKLQSRLNGLIDKLREYANELQLNRTTTGSDQQVFILFRYTPGRQRIT